MNVTLKAVEAELDYPITYDLQAGETITASSWTVVPATAGAMAVKAGSPSVAGAVVACIVTGGVFRRVYRLRNVVVTSQGRTFSQTRTFRIGEEAPQ